MDHHGDPYHRDPGEQIRLPIRILAIDVGAGTQDVLVFDSGLEWENCPKLVLPSQTQVVGRRIRTATAEGRPVHLTGVLIGGGASSDAMKAHLVAGLPLSATPLAARTLHNDLERVQGMGVTLRDDAAADAVVVETRDIALGALGSALAPFGVDLPAVVAVALQDHGDPLTLQDGVTPLRVGPTSNAAVVGDGSVYNRVES